MQTQNTDQKEPSAPKSQEPSTRITGKTETVAGTDAVVQGESKEPAMPTGSSSDKPTEPHPIKEADKGKAQS